MLKKITAIFQNNNNIYSLLGNMIVAVAYLLCMLLLTRYLSTDIFGQWTIYFTSIVFIDTLRYGLVQTPLVKFFSASESDKKKDEIIGSGWILWIITTAIFMLFAFIAFILLKDSNLSRGFILLFEWYPGYCISSISLNYAMFVLQSQENFKKLFLLRFLFWGLFVLLLILNILIFKQGLGTIIFLHTLTNILLTIFVLIKGYAQIKTISTFTFNSVKKIFNFGKYSISTMIYSNLQKSSDILLIGLFMTNSDIAFYTIPLKIIQSLDVPIQSFSMVALPLLSKENAKPDKKNLNTIFYRYIYFTLFLILPVLVIMFIFSKELILLFAGQKYIESNLSINVFRIFIAYGALLVFDRYTGVVLDSINKPRINFVKVLFLNATNIVGDIIALVYFKSLEAVAAVTLFTIFVGATFGIFILKKVTGIRISDAITAFTNDIKFFLKIFK